MFFPHLLCFIIWILDWSIYLSVLITHFVVKRDSLSLQVGTYDVSALLKATVSNSESSWRSD